MKIQTEYLLMSRPTKQKVKDEVVRELVLVERNFVGEEDYYKVVDENKPIPTAGYHHLEDEFDFVVDSLKWRIMLTESFIEHLKEALSKPVKRMEDIPFFNEASYE